LRALHACVDVYRWLRTETAPKPSAVELTVMAYLNELGGLN
jgi:hypothetical protein